METGLRLRHTKSPQQHCIPRRRSSAMVKHQLSVPSLIFKSGAAAIFNVTATNERQARPKRPPSHQWATGVASEMGVAWESYRPLSHFPIQTRFPPATSSSAPVPFWPVSLQSPTLPRSLSLSLKRKIYQANIGKREARERERERERERKKV